MAESTATSPRTGRWRRLSTAPGGIAETVRLYGTGLRLIVAGAPGPSAVFLVLVLATVAMPILQVWLAREVLDGLAAANQRGSGFDRALLWPTILYAATILIPTALNPAQSVLTSIIEDRAVPVVDREIMRCAAALPDLTRIERPAFHDEAHQLRQVVGVLPYLLFVLQNFGAALLTILGISLLLTGLHPLIPIAILLSLGPQAIAQNRHMVLYYQKMAEQSRAAREVGDAVRVVTDPGMAKEVRVFGLGDFFLDRFLDRYQMAISEMQPLRLRSLRSTLVLTIPLALALAGSLWYVSTRAANGQLSPGDIALFLNAIFQIAIAAPSVFGVARFVSTSIPPLRTLDAFRRSAGPGVAIASPDTALPIPGRVRGGIAFDGVSFAYPESETAVVEDLVAMLPAGRVTALVGANGAGKSTIVKLLTRMYDPTRGKLRIDGEPAAAYDLDGLRSRTAVVYQDFAQFALSLRENITVGAWPDDVSDNELRRAADWSGADEVAAAQPDGYDTQLTRHFAGGVELSGGQWQRVALARSALRDAAIVILDEPNAALDAEAEARQIDQLGKMAVGRTVLVISHRLSTVRRADHILVLDGGRITERGSHDDLLALDGEYSRLFAMQADRFR